MTTAPAASSSAQRDLGLVVAGTAMNAGAVAQLVAQPLAKWDRRAPSILMLGTVNSPHVEHLAVAMRDRGHRVVVGGEVAPEYPPSTLPASGVDVRPLEHPAALWLWRLAREVRPAVVHAHWLPASPFHAALLRLRPLIAMAWGSDVFKANRAATLRSRYALRHADLAMADSLALLLGMQDLGAQPAASYLLNWGVDLKRFAPPASREAERQALGLGPGPVVLSPRALAPNYNPRVILDAFESVRRNVPDAQLILKHLGTGQPDVGRPLPEGTVVIGHVPYDELARYYRAADVCVSIPASDSSPRSVWEAMACGCACVLSDLPWVHELIVSGRHA
ncbi:MAG TPA: glycosyltransferase, partial [Baekduia sp.]|nr:glycosyltransferase [Baekduia sp.]